MSKIVYENIGGRPANIRFVDDDYQPTAAETMLPFDDHLPTPDSLLTAEEQKAKAKFDRWDGIKAERDRRIQTGGYKVGAKWFHSDTFSRTQQMGLVMLGAAIPANTPWKTMDGTTVTMTQALAGQIFATAAASDIAIFAAAETHKAAMEAAADPAAYDFSGGWPKVFGE